MVNIVNRLTVKKKNGRSKNCVSCLGIIFVFLFFFQKALLPMYRKGTWLPNQFSRMVGVLVRLVG